MRYSDFERQRMQNYQTTTYDQDFNSQASPRLYRRNVSPRRVDDPPRGAAPMGDSRYYKASPREHFDKYDSRRSPRGDPYNGYRGSPQPQYNPNYGRFPQDKSYNLPPKNPLEIGTTQKDYGDWSKYQGRYDAPRKDNINFGRRPELGPYFDEKNPPSFYRDQPLTDRTDFEAQIRRQEMNRVRDMTPPPEQGGLRGQAKRDLDRIEMHDGNFKPYSTHVPKPVKSVDENEIEKYRELIKQDLIKAQKSGWPDVTPKKMSQTDASPRLPMHDYHRFEQVHKTNNPERIYPDLKYNSRFPQSEDKGGVYLFIRTNKDGEHNVIRAFQSHMGGTPHRKLEGITLGGTIEVKDGGLGWVRYSEERVWEGRHLVTKKAPMKVDKLLSVIWFPSSQDAKEWVDREPNFKESTFPWPDGNETSVMSLKYRPSMSRGFDTYMLMEFSNITDHSVLEQFIMDMNEELRSYNADVAFINCTPEAIKRPIFPPRSRVVCHRFANKSEADRFYSDVIERHKRSVENRADMTTIVFKLEDIFRLR